MTWRLAGSEEPYVPHRVLALVGSNVDLARALLRRFVDDIPREWIAIEDAIAVGEPSAVARSVHLLAGSLALVEAEHLTGRITSWGRHATGGVASVSAAELIAARDALVVLVARMRDYLRRTERGHVPHGGPAGVGATAWGSWSSGTIGFGGKS